MSDLYVYILLLVVAIKVGIHAVAAIGKSAEREIKLIEEENEKREKHRSE